MQALKYGRLSVDKQILTSAAGPTGLLSALLARQLGISVCVLDAKTGPLEVGGADAITARTQQYLEVASNGEQQKKDAGILAELLNAGVKCNSKFTAGNTHKYCPANESEQQVQRTQVESLRADRASGGMGFHTPFTTTCS